MRNSQHVGPGSVGASALVLVTVGLASLAVQQLSDSASGLAPWTCGLERILVPYVVAARIVSVVVAVALIVAGLVVIGRDQ